MGLVHAATAPPGTGAGIPAAAKTGQDTTNVRRTSTTTNENKSRPLVSSAPPTEPGPVAAVAPPTVVGSAVLPPGPAAPAHGASTAAEDRIGTGHGAAEATDQLLDRFPNQASCLCNAASAEGSGPPPRPGLHESQEASLKECPEIPVVAT